MAGLIQPPITGDIQQDSWAYQVTAALEDGILVPGTDGLFVSIEDINHTFPADEAGEVESSEVSLYDSQIQLFIGFTRIPFNANAINDAALSPNTYRVVSTTITGTGWPTPAITSITVDDIPNARLKLPSGDLPASSSNSVIVTVTLRVKGADGSVAEITRQVSFSKGVAGSTGINGFNNATASVYKRLTTEPTDSPTAAATFAFSTAALTFTTGTSAVSNGWHTTIDAATGSDQLWLRVASAVSRSTSDTVAANEWSGVIQSSSTGDNGLDGINSTTVLYYQRTSTSTAPSLLPDEEAAYNFGTGALTPAENNGWQTLGTLSSTGAYLWVTTATAASRASTDTIATTEWSDAVFNTKDGTDGTSGTSSRLDIGYFDVLAGTTGVFPTGTLAAGNYTKATRGSNNFQGTNVVTWISNTTEPAVSTAASAYEITQITGGKGDTGIAGDNSATVPIYLRKSGDAPTTKPTGTAVYTFATATLTTGGLNGWTAAIPSGDDTLYARYASAVANTAADVISPGDWSGVVQLEGDVGSTGDDGINTATVYYYQWSTSATAPAQPNEEVTYTFATSSVGASQVDNRGWTFAYIPAKGSNTRLYQTSATAAANTATDTITTTEWSTAREVSLDGLNGLSNRFDIAYADSSDGTGNTQRPSGTKAAGDYATASSTSTNKYIGTNVVTWTTTEPAVSTTNSDYEWSKFAGEDSTVAGDPGVDAPRNANGTVYYSIAQASAPSAPTASAYNFATGVFGSLTANWSKDATTLAASQSALYYQATYTVVETTLGGVQATTFGAISSVASFSNLVVTGGAGADVNAGSVKIGAGKIVIDGDINITQPSSGDHDIQAWSDDVKRSWDVTGTDANADGLDDSTVPLLTGTGNKGLYLGQTIDGPRFFIGQSNGIDSNYIKWTGSELRSSPNAFKFQSSIHGFYKANPARAVTWMMKDTAPASPVTDNNRSLTNDDDGDVDILDDNVKMIVINLTDNGAISLYDDIYSKVTVGSIFTVTRNGSGKTGEKANVEVLDFARVTVFGVESVTGTLFWMSVKVVVPSGADTPTAMTSSAEITDFNWRTLPIEGLSLDDLADFSSFNHGIALGKLSEADTKSFAAGYNALAGNASVAIGYKADAGGSNSKTGGTAIGADAVASGVGSTAIGKSATAAFSDSGAIGKDAVARAENVLTIGDDGTKVEIARHIIKATDNDYAVTDKLYVDTEVLAAATTGADPRIPTSVTVGNYPRFSSGAGAMEQRSDSQVRTDLNVEDGATADQTNAEIITAVNTNTKIKALTDFSGTPVFTDTDNNTQLTNAQVVTAASTNTKIKALTDFGSTPVFTDTQLTNSEVVTAANTDTKIKALTDFVGTPVFTDNNTQLSDTAVVTAAKTNTNLELLADYSGTPVFTDTDNNTEYSAGNGITLSTTTFSADAHTGITVDADGISVSYPFVSTDKAAIGLNTDKKTNFNHTGDVTGDEALSIGDGKVTNAHLGASAVSLDKLAISEFPTVVWKTTYDASDTSAPAGNGKWQAFTTALTGNAANGAAWSALTGVILRVKDNQGLDISNLISALKTGSYIRLVQGSNFAVYKIGSTHTVSGNLGSISFDSHFQSTASTTYSNSASTEIEFQVNADAVVDGNLLITGSVDTNSIKAGAITSSKLTIDGDITIKKPAAGTDHDIQAWSDDGERSWSISTDANASGLDDSSVPLLAGSGASGFYLGQTNDGPRFFLGSADGINSASIKWDGNRLIATPGAIVQRSAYVADYSYLIKPVGTTFFAPDWTIKTSTPTPTDADRSVSDSSGSTTILSSSIKQIILKIEDYSGQDRYSDIFSKIEVGSYFTITKDPGYTMLVESSSRVDEDGVVDSAGEYYWMEVTTSGSSSTELDAGSPGTYGLDFIFNSILRDGLGINDMIDGSTEGYSVSLGDKATSSAAGVAVGNNASSFQQGVSIGQDSTNSGLGSTAVGHGSIATPASGLASATAIGASATASGTSSTAIGRLATASGDNSTALGYQATATGLNSMALGNGAVIEDTTVELLTGGAQVSYISTGSSSQLMLSANTSTPAVASAFATSTASRRFTTGIKRIYLSSAFRVSTADSSAYEDRAARDDLIEQIKTAPIGTVVTLTTNQTAATGGAAIAGSVVFELTAVPVEHSSGLSTGIPSPDDTATVVALEINVTSASAGFATTDLAQSLAAFTTLSFAIKSDNRIRLGNSSVIGLHCNTQVISSLSDERDKANIEDIDEDCGLDFINDLQPRKFDWDRREWYEDGVPDGTKIMSDRTNEPNSGKQMGFIAQEVETLITGMECIKDSNLVTGTHVNKQMAYSELITPMVKAIQQLSSENDALKARLDTLENL